MRRAVLHSEQRYARQLQLLADCDADLIALNEVTPRFLALLLAAPFAAKYLVSSAGSREGALTATAAAAATGHQNVLLSRFSVLSLQTMNLPGRAAAPALLAVLPLRRDAATNAIATPASASAASASAASASAEAVVEPACVNILVAQLAEGQDVLAARRQLLACMHATAAGPPASVLATILLVGLAPASQAIEDCLAGLLSFFHKARWHYLS